MNPPSPSRPWSTDPIHDEVAKMPEEKLMGERPFYPIDDPQHPAPRDGTWVELRWADQGTMMDQEAQFCDNEWYGRAGGALIAPTHWRPIPPLAANHGAEKDVSTCTCPDLPNPDVHLSGCPLAKPSPAPASASGTQEEAKYPCERCGQLRTKAEGGTTFTVCDACWDVLHPKATSEQESGTPLADAAYLESLQWHAKHGHEKTTDERLDTLVNDPPPANGWQTARSIETHFRAELLATAARLDETARERDEMKKVLTEIYCDGRGREVFPGSDSWDGTLFERVEKLIK